MAASSPQTQDLQYLYASNANVSNFVSVKLSGKHNYHSWRTQMLCLMETHNMSDIVHDDYVFGPRAPSERPIKKQYDSLAKGWIFGSVSGGVLDTVVDLDSAEDVWRKLKSDLGSDKDFQPTIPTKQDLQLQKKIIEAWKKFGGEKKKICVVDPEENETESEHAITIDIEAGKDTILEEAETTTEEQIAIKIEEEMKKKMEETPRCKELQEKITEAWKKFGGEKKKNCVVDPEENETESEHAITSDIEAGKDTISEEAETTTEEQIAIKIEEEMKKKMEETPRCKELQEKITEAWKKFGGEKRKKMKRRMAQTKLIEATHEGNWWKVKEILENDKDAMKKRITHDGGTMIHMVCQRGYDYLLTKLLLFLKKEQVGEILEQRDKNGSTALDVAVSVGNKYAMNLLVNKHKHLLTISDKNGQDPFLKAFDNMHFDASVYLLEAALAHDKDIVRRHIQGGASLLTNAITEKQYSTALKLMHSFPKYALVRNEEVLVAITRTFPSELNYWETLIYPPRLKDRHNRGARLFYSSRWWDLPWRKSIDVYYRISKNIRTRGHRSDFMGAHGHLILKVPLFTFFWVRGLIGFLIWMVFFPLRLPYLLLWKVAARLVPPIKHIEEKIKKLEEAERVLKLVCDEIDKRVHSNHYPYYNIAITEAAVQNADKVMQAIVYRSGQEVSKSKDANGYNIFQLAVIHRSEKIYNLFLHEIGEDKNRYRAINDSFDNNLLHLAGRLAPSHVLERITGAALQLQRELQWFEELKKFMHPSDITKENSYGDTPPMMFTREHENLLKEGEKWMKTTAESCSISAALITTIVFAAAITVPGGSNQETGIPMFRKDIAFTIFAMADAMSLFTSTSSLMVFLSILTARFAEKDFLVILPKRLIIGLCTLLLSITAMMVAFGATLYLVFCRERPWMVGPICVFACLPILFFVTLQFPLIADLYRSTFVPIFRKRLLNPFDVQGVSVIP